MAVLEAEAALAAGDNAGASRLAHRALGSGAAAAEVRCHALEIIGRAGRLHDLGAAPRRSPHTPGAPHDPANNRGGE